MDLEGTRPGPHYVFMTRQEQRHHVDYFGSDPSGQQQFALIKARADVTLAGHVEEEGALFTAFLVSDERKYLDTWQDRFLAGTNRLNTLYPTPFDLAKCDSPRDGSIGGRAREYNLLTGHLSPRVEQLFRCS